jgi:hypothetical protein
VFDQAVEQVAEATSSLLANLTLRAPSRVS